MGGGNQRQPMRPIIKNPVVRRKILRIKKFNFTLRKMTGGGDIRPKSLQINRLT